MIIEMQVVGETWEARQVTAIFWDDEMSYYDVQNNILYPAPHHQNDELIIFLRGIGFSEVGRNEIWNGE